MTAGAIGFVGLGNMGRPMAERLAGAGQALVVFDAVDAAARAPAGATAAASVEEVARRTSPVFLSLPDGAAVDAVARSIAGVHGRTCHVVVDCSTIGVEAAQAVAATFAAAGIDYADAPVSGGVAGATAGTLTVMVAARPDLFEALRPLLEVVAAHCHHVGSAPGQGQAMKLINNLLSATALVATSEALAFGERHGLGLETMLAVLNVSTGRNTATSDKFPRRILTGTFDAGFATRLMAKDVRLYLDGVLDAGTAHDVARAVLEVWERAERRHPEGDFTRVWEVVREGGR
jgi:3-hydroxyisobutyrate dehydrogenase-like beta-hydroxyacid dehydrogenase